MKRFGCPKEQMGKPMDPPHIFHQRLQLLIVMVKAKLKGYPVGQYRKAAVVENAALLHKGCARIDIRLPGAHASTHLFKERVKLLSIMASAMISDEYPLGLHRREAVLENMDSIIATVFPKQEIPLFHDILMAA